MRLATALLTLTALPCAAFADGFDYTFVEGGLVNSDIDGVNVDGDGFGLSGSFAIGDNMRIIAGYDDIEYDFGVFGDVDGSIMTLGAGFNTGLTADLDFVADLSYVDAEATSGVASADETGYRIGAGIRGRTSSKLELEAGLIHLNLDGSDTGIRVGGRYYFSDSFAAGLGLTDIDDSFSWTLGIRAEFGNR
jgi:hypothetical protein